MDLSGVDIKPAEGMVAVKFVDDGDGDDDAASATPSEPMPYEGVLAIVLGVGAKTSVKKGDTIVVRPYARDGLCLGDGVYLIDSYCIAATIGK
jgi:hypothetical protein